jgi:hypothetical protein
LFEKMVAAAGNSEQFRELRQGDRQRGAGLEPGEDRAADEVHQAAQPQQPR